MELRHHRRLLSDFLVPARHMVTKNSLGKSSFYYPEQPPPVRRRRRRRGWGYRECGVKQITNRPRPIGKTKCNGRRGVQPLMAAAPIVMRHVQADGRRLVLQLL